MTALAPEELVHKYRPRGTHRLLQKDKRREILMAGPAGTGKTRACLEKVNWVAAKYPGARILLVRKTLESLKGSALVSYQNHVIPEAVEAGIVIPFGGNSFKPPQFTYSNGSLVMAGGMDKATKVMSAEYDLCYVNEATELDEDDWESLLTRLRNGRVPWQQLIADCNPAENTHWLKQRADSGKTIMYNTRHEENPVYFEDDGSPTPAGKDYVLGTLESLTGVRRLRLRDGQWAAAEGMIYTEFNPAVHLIDPFDVPDSWARYWTVDFGVVHPFVWQNWAVHEDAMYLTQEVYMTQRTVEDHVRTIKRVTNGQPRPQKVLVDHQAQERLILDRELGIRCTTAKKDVLPGIEAMQMRFKKRRIFFFRHALVERDQAQMDAKLPCATIEEIPGYVWLDKDKPKEGPVKKNDDGMDAARYLAAELDIRDRPSIRGVGGRR